MKYIIELEKINGTNLYKAKDFNTLVFDEIGISKLQALRNVDSDVGYGDLITTPNGTIVYEYRGKSKDGNINAVNTSNGRYISLSGDKFRIVQKASDLCGNDTLTLVNRVIRRIEEELRAFGFISTTHAQNVFDKTANKVRSEYEH